MYFPDCSTGYAVRGAQNGDFRQSKKPKSPRHPAQLAKAPDLSTPDCSQADKSKFLRLSVKSRFRGGNGKENYAKRENKRQAFRDEPANTPYRKAWEYYCAVDVGNSRLASRTKGLSRRSASYCRSPTSLSAKLRRGLFVPSVIAMLCSPCSRPSVPAYERCGYTRPRSRSTRRGRRRYPRSLCRGQTEVRAKQCGPFAPT